MSSKEEDFACDKFVPQKWRKDVCRNCYQTLRLHEKKIKTTSSPSIQPKPLEKPPVTPTQAKFKQNQDVSTVSPSPPHSQEAMVTGPPKKNVVKPASRQPPPPPPRRSSLKSFVPPKSSKPDIPTTIQDEKPVIPDAIVTQPTTSSVIPTVSSVTPSPQNGSPYSPPPNPPIPDGSSTSVEGTTSFVPTPPLTPNTPATAGKDISSPKKTVEPLSESGLLESKPVEITETHPQTHSETILQEPMVPQQEKPQESPQGQHSEPLQAVEYLEPLDLLPQEVTLEGSSQPSLTEMEVPSSKPFEVEDTLPQEAIPEIQVIPTNFNIGLTRVVDVLQEKEDNEEDVVLLLSEDLQYNIISPSRMSPSPSIPPPPAPSPAATPITIGIPIPPPPPPLTVINPPILPHVRVLSFPPANIPPPPPPPSPPPLPPPPAFASSSRDDAHFVSISPPDTPIEMPTEDLESNRQMVMEQIRSGVQLRSVTPPPERTPTEEKVVDVRSELRQRMQQKRREEADTLAPKIEEHRKEVKTLTDQLFRLQRSPTYFHNLVSMLEKLRDFQDKCEIPVDMLIQKLNWPTWAIDYIQEVIDLMKRLESKVVDVEKLCDKTLQSNQINVEAVKTCVTQVILTAKQVQNEHNQETRYSEALNAFPIDPIDIHRLLRRGAESVTPLLDKLYEKALQSHAFISDPSISKFDLTFRLQNAQRLLTMCCNMSDNLATVLDVPRHPKYSEAMLKKGELEEQYKRQMDILERKGEWDVDQEVNLQSSYGKRSSTVVKEETLLIQQIIDTITKGGNSDDLQQLVTSRLTKELFQHVELQLIKAAIASCSTKTIDAVFELRDQLVDVEEARHRRDFDWLNEAVIKTSYQCLEHLVKVCNISVNCQSVELGNSALHIAARRQDWSTMSCLVRLGANPLIESSSSRTPLQMVGLKCFVPQHFPKVESKELPFDLSCYINNPSLSDGQIETSEGELFYVHRLILCGQSPVFKSLLESEHWTADRQDGNKVTLPTVNARTMKLLLQHLYTGQSTFPQDDLNTWIDLLAAADQFLLEPLRLQCEQVLSGKIDEEVVIPMLHAATRFSANKLLVNCCNYLMTHYDKVEDEGNQTLLYVLDNAEIIIPKQTDFKI